MDESMRPFGAKLLTALTALWLLGVGFGLSRLQDYDSAVSPPAEPPDDWPAPEVIQRSPGRYTVLVFLHPHCPCSRATVGEYEQIVARCAGRADFFALFCSPEGPSSGWERGDNWSAAAAIPTVHVLSDAGGRLARRFGAHTSGQVLVYEPDGRLAFSGGITQSRGHRGDNAGRSAVLSILTGSRPATTEAPVFGCPLIESNAGDAAE
jgi:hypothetical protein